VLPSIAAFWGALSEAIGAGAFELVDEGALPQLVNKTLLKRTVVTKDDFFRTFTKIPAGFLKVFSAKFSARFSTKFPNRRWLDIAIGGLVQLAIEY
jgi:hypothetical protein